MRACRVAAKRKTAGQQVSSSFGASWAQPVLRMTLQVGCSRSPAPALCRTAALRATYPPPALPLRGVVPRGTRPSKPPPDPPTPPAPSAPPARRLAFSAVPRPSSSSGQYMSPSGASYPAPEPRLEPPSIKSLTPMRAGIARIREPAAVGTICSASDEAIQKFSGAADAWRPLTLRMTWQVRQAIVTHHLCQLPRGRVDIARPARYAPTFCKFCLARNCGLRLACRL